jgi:hypothetical protein
MQVPDGCTANHHQVCETNVLVRRLWADRGFVGIIATKEKPTTRTTRFGTAAALLVVAGCGGSDEPGLNTSPVATTDSLVQTSDAGTASSQQQLIPLGTSSNVGEGWHLTINAVDTDATSSGQGGVQVGEPGETGDSRAPGESFVLIEVTPEYKGLDENGSAPSLVDMKLVGNDGASYDDWCNISMERPLNYQTLLVAGESISGQVCYRFPTAQLNSMVLVASATWPRGRY